MYQNTTNIKSWAEDDRPREKLQLKGKSALSDAELLAIVLGSGTRNKSAVELAQEILQANNNNLYNLGKKSQSDFMKFSGIGMAKAITLIAVLELGRRRNAAEIPINSKITEAKTAYEIIRHQFQDLQHEEFRVMGLTRSNRIIDIKLISKGGLAGTVADGKIIFKELLDMKAAASIIFHNHPSGNLSPSSADIELTKRLVQFGKMIDLPILDHIIVADVGFYSFAENGRL